MAKKAAAAEAMEVVDVNWINMPAKFPARILAKIRYRNQAVYATIRKSKDGLKVVFDEPQRAVTPGQSAVFYGEGGVVLGGGTIAEILNKYKLSKYKIQNI